MSYRKLEGNGSMTAEKTGRLIKELRLEKGLTQKELAAALYITDRAVSKWERGKSMPELSLMQSICTILGVSLPELLRGERGKADVEPKDSANMIMQLADREKEEKAKRLNWYFSLGLLFHFFLILHEYVKMLDGLKESTLAPLEFGLLALLGIGFEVVGFYQNNKGSRGRTFTMREIEVLTGDEKEVRMKTAGEMLQFARKSQKAELKQYRLGFAKIEQQLDEDEQVLFSMVGNGYMLNDNPGPWHAALAVTDNRLILSGESVRGRMYTYYTLDSFERSEIISVELVNRRLVLKTVKTKVTLEGEKLESVAERLREAVFGET